MKDGWGYWGLGRGRSFVLEFANLGILRGFGICKVHCFVLKMRGEGFSQTKAAALTAESTLGL